MESYSLASTAGSVTLLRRDAVCVVWAEVGREMGDGRRKKGNKRPDARSLGPVDKDPPPPPPIVFGHPWFAV